MSFGNRNYNPGGQKEAPVSVGGEYEVEIEAVGDKGDGISKVKGFVVFVPGVNTGDKVKVKVNKVLSNVAFGEVVEKQKKPEPKPEPVDTEDFGEEPAVEETAEDEEASSEESSVEDPAVEKPVEEETADEEAPAEETPEEEKSN